MFGGAAIGAVLRIRTERHRPARPKPPPAPDTGETDVAFNFALNRRDGIRWTAIDDGVWHRA